MATERPSPQVAVLDARELFASSRDGLFVLDMQGCFLDANPAALKLVGCSLDDLRRMNLADVLTSRFSPQAILTAGKREIRLCRTDGRMVQAEAEGVSISYDGRPACLWMVRDITHYRQIEEALCTRIAQLEGRSQDRPAVADGSAGRLWLPGRMNSQLIVDVSHELRTPIATFKLYLALLRKAPPEKYAEYLDALEHEVNRQAQLVEDVVQISRLDSGRLKLRPRPLLINRLVESIANDHHEQARERELSLECRLDRRVTEVVVDAERIQDALQRLIVNAFQYTPPGGRVVLSTSREQATWTVIRVTDTGTGIGEDDLPHIFERFFRGEEAHKRDLPGTGLGLAIAREIVELHGGYLTAHSQPGAGTTLAVWLPGANGQPARGGELKEQENVHDE